MNPIVVGLGCRCPGCGKGPLFEGYLKVAPTCKACGLDLSRADSGDGPAVFVLLIVGGVVAFLMLYVELVFRPPIWLHLIVWLPLTLVLSLALARPLKGLMIALQFHNRASEHRTDE